MGKSRRYSIASKILAIAGSFTLPIAVLVYFIVSTIQQDIDFATLEIKGDTYQRPLEEILDGIQAHEIVAVSLATLRALDSRRVGESVPIDTRAFLEAALHPEDTGGDN